MLRELHDANSNLITVDAGDLLFNVPNPPPADRETAERKLKLLLQAYNECQYDALNVGINDLALGGRFLQQFQSMAQFPLISANITDEQGNPVFKPYILVKRNKVTVAIVGVTSGNTLADTLHFADVVQTARAVRKQIGPKADYTVLLASVYNPDADRLKQADLSYDLIVRSHSPRSSLMLDKSSDGYYLQTGKEGRNVQLVQIQQTNRQQPLVDLSMEKQRLRFIESRLDTFDKLAGNQSVEQKYDKGTITFVHSLRKQKEELEQTIDKQLNYIALDAITLGSTVPDNPEWLDRVEEFQAYYQQVADQ